MNRISACLITLNEEANLARALASLSGVADEIVVIDSGSSDRTEEIAR
jgi:glycosyltransferase involved in cell wall biosynthesis